MVFFNMYLSKNDCLVSCLTLDCERVFTNEYHIFADNVSKVNPNTGNKKRFLSFAAKIIICVVVF